MNKHLDLIEKVKWNVHANKIKSLLKPAIKIIADKLNSQIPTTGESKFGGKPDLPMDIKWPLNPDNEPMAFLAQINLKDIRSFDEINILPGKGMLYFFIDEPDKFTLHHKVFYVSETQNLIPRNFPKKLSRKSRFKPNKMKFQPIYTLPDMEIIEEYKKKRTTVEDYNNYMELIDIFYDESNQILGYPKSIQNDVILDWINKYWKIPDSEIEELRKNNRDLLYQKYGDFETLLQFSTEKSLNEFWDNYTINSIGYIGIRKSDLENLNFDDTVLEFQYF